MRYSCADIDACIKHGIDTMSHVIIDDKVILNENDLAFVGGTPEKGAALLNCDIMSHEEMDKWFYEHKNKTN